MITGYFGLPGCGKSSFAAKFARKYIKKGFRVFCLADYPIEGCELFQWSDIGKFDMSNSVILIDEISLYADNRDYKKFMQEVKQFFILHRHYHCDIIWFTQQYDGVDKKIRELTTCLYYVRSMGTVSYAVRIDRFITVDKETRQILVGYKLSSLIRCLFAWLNGSLKLCFRPRWYKYFDSFNAPELPRRLWPKYPADVEFDPGSKLYLETDEGLEDPEDIDLLELPWDPDTVFVQQ